MHMLDTHGFRPNVAIILCNTQNQVLLAKRIRQQSWQFPQGGIKRGESVPMAMYRELQEEIGLRPHHVEILGRTKHWLRYEIPSTWVRRDVHDRYKGQKQIWFLLRLLGQDSDVSLTASAKPEFDAWRWNNYWLELNEVVEFKRGVYRLALKELFHYLPAL